MDLDRYQTAIASNKYERNVERLQELVDELFLFFHDDMPERSEPPTNHDTAELQHLDSNDRQMAAHQREIRMPYGSGPLRGCISADKMLIPCISPR